MSGAAGMSKMEGEPRHVLTRGLLARLALRGLLLQAAWNFERMQHLGFCFALLPLLRRLHPERGAPGFRDALRRHLEFFNTHPVMAAPILGVVARLEAAGEGTAARSFKLSLMGSYGAIGDSFFWSAVRPVAGIVGVAAGLLWVAGGLPGGAEAAAFVGPAVALTLYNVPQLWLRAFGVFGGARLGVGIVEAIRRFELPELTGQIRAFGAAALGLVAASLLPPAGRLAAAALAALPGAAPGAGAVATAAWAAGGALLLASILAAFGLFRRGVVPTRFAWVLAAVALAGAAWQWQSGL